MMVLHLAGSRRHVFFDHAETRLFHESQIPLSLLPPNLSVAMRIDPRPPLLFLGSGTSTQTTSPQKSQNSPSGRPSPSRHAPRRGDNRPAPLPAVRPSSALRGSRHYLRDR